MQTVNLFRDSADAVEAILSLHFPHGSILDANYGLGVFYKKVRHRHVVGIDLKPTGQVVADNRRLPFADDSFDVGVLDPPYKRGDGFKYEHRYGVAPKTETKVNRLYLDALPEVVRVSRGGVVIKGQDGTDGHRTHCRMLLVANAMREVTGLDPHDACYVARPKKAGTMAQGLPHFFQSGLSWFLIYRWRAKAPFRPVRF